MQGQGGTPVKSRQPSNRLLPSDPLPDTRRPVRRSTRTGERLVRWRRRHVNLRTAVVLIVLSGLLAPEAAMIIDVAQ